MSKLMILLLLSCVVLQVVSEQFTSLASYQERVLDTKAPWLIFFGPGPVDFSSSAFETIKTKISQYNIELGGVDCSVKEFKKTCQALGPNVPSLHFFVDTPKLNPYTKKLYRASLPHQAKDGSVDLASIERFISKTFPNNVVKVVDMESYEAAVKGNKKSTVLLFSDKDAVSMLYKSVAYEFSEEYQFIQVTRAASEVADKFEISSFPGLIVQSFDGKVTQFQPEDKADLKSRSAIASWLATQKSTLKTESASESSTGSSSKSNNTGKSDTKAPSRITRLEDSFDVASVPVDESWVVFVSSTDSSKAVNEDWDKTAKWCEGKIRAADYQCLTDGGNRSPLVSALCAELASPERAEGNGIYFVVPYGTTTGSRKRLLLDTSSVDSMSTKSKLSTFIFSANQHEQARRTAAESLPEHSVRFLESDAGVQAFMNDNAGQNLLSAIVVADKENPPAFLRNVAVTLAEKAKIGYTSTIPSSLASVIGSVKLPTAILLFPGPPTDKSKPGEMQIGLYEPNVFGPLKFNSLVGFILHVYRSSAYFDESAEASRGGSGSAQGSPAGDVQSAVDLVTTPSDWDTTCGESFRGVCAVALTDGAETDAALTGTLQAIGSAGAAFKFLSVDGRCQRNFAAAFEVDQNQIPTVVAFSPSKRRFAAYRGAYSSTSAKDFLLSVLSGQTKTIPMSERPAISPECDQVESVDAIPAEDSLEDASDFLEEIRREEAERAARVKKELEEEAKRAKAEAEASAAASKLKDKKKSKKKSSKKSSGKSEL